MSRTKVIAFAAVGVAALSATALADILPGRSVSGVKVGMSEKQVIAELGKPDKKGCLDRQGVGDCTPKQTQYGYPSRKLTVTFVAGKVADIKTTSKSQRDGRGVGPGSKRSQILKAYPKAKPGPYNGLFVPQVPTKKGQRYTEFTFFGGDGGKRADGVIVGRYDKRDFCVFGCG